MRNSLKTLLKVAGALTTFLLLTGMLAQPAAAADNEKSYFWAEADLVREKVCPHRSVVLLYQLMFRGSDYERDMKNQGKIPHPSLSHPAIKVTASQGNISDVKDLNVTYEGQPPYDDLFKSWNDTFTFTPDKPGNATVRLTATYMGFTTSTKWDIRVWEDCKYTVEISADESSLKMSSGETVNEAQNDWSIIIYLKGLAKSVLADPLVNEGGSGGEKRLIAVGNPLWNQEDVTGTIETFGDGIWLGNEPDFVCGTNGAITCSHKFTVHPETGEETIDFQIDMLSGHCSGFTVWCKGPDGGGEASIPPMSNLSFKMDAEIPREGGSAHYVHQLPYGVTMDYLISAFPEVEE
jgi:hypothetical protein